MLAAKRVAGIVGGLAAGALFTQQSSTAAGDKNSAFVFIKPHANTPAAQALVSKTLTSKGIVIDKEGELTGEQVRSSKYNLQ